MPRYFCDSIINEKAYISGDDARHIIKVLRKKIGDTLTICDTNGFDYNGNITGITDLIEVTLTAKTLNSTEPSCKVTLFQALPKGDKMEFIIQKAIELGVTEIVPVQTRFCVTKIDKTSEAKKNVRFNKIALAAAKQSERGIIPKVTETLDFNSAITAMKKSKISLMFYEKADKLINDIIDAETKSLSFMVGSEGGFAEEEVNYATKNGIHIISLGNRILRCETASIVAASLIMNATGNI